MMALRSTELQPTHPSPMVARSLPPELLPPEILGIIFAMLVTKPDFSDYLYIRNKHAPDWKVVTHVCSRWRRVALETPTLWCYIHVPAHIFKKLWLDAFLERSKSLPLDVEVFFQDDPQDDPSPAPIAELSVRVLKEIHRIRELLLDLDYHDTGPPTDPLISALTHEAPVLERLTLQAFPWTIPAFFPEPFLGGNAPQLCDLHLNGTRMPKDLSMLSNLTKLTLDDICHTLSLNDFITALSSAPNLVSLELRSICATYNDNDDIDMASDYPIVHLSHLEILDVYDCISACTTLLLRLQPPSTVSYSIATFDKRVSPMLPENPTSSLAQLSNSFSSKLTAPSIQFLALSATPSPDYLEIKARCEEGGSSLDLTLEDESVSYLQDSAYGTILMAPCFSSLQTLHVETFSVEPQVWISVFYAIPTLRRITVIGISVRHFVDALCSDPDTQHLSNLQVLVVDGGEHRDSEDTTTRWEEGQWTIILQPLEVWLEERVLRVGKRLQKLFLKHLQLSSDLVERFRIHVGDVAYDEHLARDRT